MRNEQLTVRDVMTANLLTCTLDATLQEVAQRMIEADSGIIPLIDQGRPVAVITDRDIAVRAVAKGVDVKTAKAREFSTPAAEHIAPDASVEEACEQMEHWHIRRLLVVENDRLVGIVSLGDLAETVREHADHVLVEVSKSPKTLAHDAAQ